MNVKLLLLGSSMSLVLATLAAAQEHAVEHPRYRLVDLGTLGGPLSYGSADGSGGRILNNAGVVSSYADTTEPDPNAPDFCFDPDCLVAHAYRWRQGVMEDLGSLAPGVSSLVANVNDRGWGIGESQTGIFNPAGFPQVHATLWIGRRIIDLGVVPGGSDSIGTSINNAGQAVGISNNGVADPFSPSVCRCELFSGKRGAFATLVLWADLTLSPDPVATISDRESLWDFLTLASRQTRPPAFPRKIHFFGTTAKCGT
jgi:hypothetical protein